MYAFINGIVSGSFANFIVLDCNGVGYKLFTHKRLLNMAVDGERLKLYTYLVVREDELSLYGFETLEEKDIFEKLISVSGIGPKAGINILSDMDYSQIVHAILSSDTTAFSRVSGIGKKSAERIVVDLKDKIDAKAELGITPSSNKATTNQLDEAVEALISLGYQKNVAVDAVKAVSSLADTAEELILMALKRMDIK